MFDITHVITTIDRGGAEKHLLQLASAQVSKGFRVRVIFLKGSGELSRDFEQNGCLVVNHLSNKNILIQILKLRRIFKDDCRVIHAHLPRAELLTSISSINKFVVTRHNAEKFFPKAPDFLSRLLSRYVSLNTYACIGISNSVKAFLLENREWPSNSEITVIHYGVQAHTLNPSVEKKKLLQDLKIPNTSKVVGTIARVVPQKDYPTLLKSFEIVNKKYPNSYLISVGEGFLQPEMHKLSIELRIAENIRWIGKVENVDNYLQLFDCFVLTSIYEGFGLVLLEAANAGLPIVASNISAIPEVLGRAYKYLAQPGSCEQFANFIIQSLTESSPIDLVKINQEIMDRFSVEKMLNSTLETYGIKQIS